MFRSRGATLLTSIAIFAFEFTSFGADWPMRGLGNDRNPVSSETGAPIDWTVPSTDGKPKNIKWSMDLGYLSHGEPVISNGFVWVGTNNWSVETKNGSDASVLMCLREQDGKLLFKYVSPRLSSSKGRYLDWPGTSMSSSPLIEGDRLWFCTNRCEVICLNIAPLASASGEPEVVWKLDMIRELGVLPLGVMIGCHSIHCSIASYKDLIYINTTDSLKSGEARDRPAPGLICLQKKDGAIRWQESSPANEVMGAQYGNPLVVEIEGKAQVIAGQGDEFVRSFDALTGKVQWSFNLLASSVATKRRYHRDLIVLPMFHDNRVYFAIGKDMECCYGQGRLLCLDPTKRGDISDFVREADGIRTNPNSGLIWDYLGDADREESCMHCTLAGAAIHNGILIIGDSEGVTHCLDSKSGKVHWIDENIDSNICGSALIVDDKVYVPSTTGVSIYKLSRKKSLIARLSEHELIEAGPVYANGVLYLMSRKSLFAVSAPK